MTRTRLRPKHRRALLAALPPLADELRDGRLVALAADLLADRGAPAPPSLPDREAGRLAAEVKAARDEAERLRRDLQDRRAEVARLQAAVASPEGSGVKRRLRALEQELAEVREGARADAAAADSAIALLDATLAGMANLLGEGSAPADADLPLGAVDLLARLRARLLSPAERADGSPVLGPLEVRSDPPGHCYPAEAHAVEVDPQGVERFRRNRIVDDLLDFTTRECGFDLNAIARFEAEGRYSRAERGELYRLLGLSLCGFADAFPRESAHDADC